MFSSEVVKQNVAVAQLVLECMRYAFKHTDGNLKCVGSETESFADVRFWLDESPGVIKHLPDTLRMQVQSGRGAKLIGDSSLLFYQTSFAEIDKSGYPRKTGHFIASVT